MSTGGTTTEKAKAPLFRGAFFNNCNKSFFGLSLKGITF